MACDDMTAAEFCTTTLAECGDASPAPTQAQCVSLVKAMSGQGRTALQECTMESACDDCFNMATDGTLFVPEP
jgi:hypothetical protein